MRYLDALGYSRSLFNKFSYRGNASFVSEASYPFLAATRYTFTQAAVHISGKTTAHASSIRALATAGYNLQNRARVPLYPEAPM